MNTVKVNTSAVLPYNTTFQRLDLIPNATHRVAAWTYHGLNRCPRCLCLQNRPQEHQRACKGQIRMRAHGFSCPEGCGLLFESAYKAKTHAKLCVKLPIRFDRYSTCICPKCNIPGFTTVTITRHVRECTGLREHTMASYSPHQPIYHCKECAEPFLRNALRTHVCHVVGDPVWEGLEAGPPDLSISYVRWCRERDLSLGGVPGRMPDAIPDATISVPSGQGQNLALTMVEDDSLEAEVTVETASFFDELEGRASDDSDHHEDDTVREPREILAAAGITYHQVTSANCRGVLWRHGYFPCPFHATISIDNVHLIPFTTDQGDRVIQLDNCCRGCTSLRFRIRKWICEGKFTVDGQRICRRTSCKELTVALWHCRRHADQVTKWHHSALFRQTKAKAISSEDLATFRQAFLSSPAPPRLVCPAWTAVREAMRGVESPASVFFVDTECVYDYEAKHFIVCQITLLSARAEVVFETLIDHGLTFRQLKTRTKSIFWPKLNQVYHFAHPDAQTSGMSRREAADALARIGMSPNTHLVEWSMGGFDLSAMRHTFDRAPLPKTPLLGHSLWRSLGLQGSVALQALFHSFDPASPLNRTHHEATVDCTKLYAMVDGALQLFW